jgi:hypothetical protein
VGVVAVAFASAARDAAVAGIGRRARGRSGLALRNGVVRSGFGRVLLAAARTAMRAIRGRSLVAGRHLSAVLLITLVGRIDLDISLAALLVDVPVPRVGSTCL